MNKKQMAQKMKSFGSGVKDTAAGAAKLGSASIGTGFQRIANNKVSKFNDLGNRGINQFNKGKQELKNSF